MEKDYSELTEKDKDLLIYDLQNKLEGMKKNVSALSQRLSLYENMQKYGITDEDIRDWKDDLKASKKAKELLNAKNLLAVRDRTISQLITQIGELEEKLSCSEKPNN